MAQAYLLASVLTIVALVHGQEAVSGKDRVDVVEDSLVDEMNLFSDLIIHETADIRIECDQKKKCTKKGGTCQKKGTTCPGKFVKGCSKRCSCCLPEEITCSRSKKCIKANGVCMNKGECDGKIIAKGCNRPRSCKRSHVCCVQDETTTEAPACPIGSRCLVEIGECPGTGEFPTNYVCGAEDGGNCKTEHDANRFMNADPTKPLDNPYYLFAKETFYGTPISYESINTDKCKIRERVQAWSCKKKQFNKWSCSPQGFCTAEIEKVGVDYKPNAGSIKCTCPNPIFVDKHVCSHCKNSAQALDFVNDGDPPTAGLDRDVFTETGVTGMLQYEESRNKKLCSVINPWIFTWKCIPTANAEAFGSCEDLGYCNKIVHTKKIGHFEYKMKICFTQTSNIWGDECPQTGEIIQTTYYEKCMTKCNDNDDCNAINYKVGVECSLRKCPPTIPPPTIDSSGYVGYHLVNTGTLTGK